VQSRWLHIVYVRFTNVWQAMHSTGHVLANKVKCCFRKNFDRWRRARQRAGDRACTRTLAQSNACHSLYVLKRLCFTHAHRLLLLLSRLRCSCSHQHTSDQVLCTEPQQCRAASPALAPVAQPQCGRANVPQGAPSVPQHSALAAVMCRYVDAQSAAAGVVAHCAPVVS
jgi:hypothetical protein